MIAAGENNSNPEILNQNQSRLLNPKKDAKDQIVFDLITGDELKNIVEICNLALSKMPDGSRGLVVGAGDNSSRWHEKGWESLDFLLDSNATYVGDANDLANVSRPPYNFILAEYLTFHFIPGNPAKRFGANDDSEFFYDPAVGWKEFLANSAQCLNPDGCLIIQTVDFGSKPKSIPRAEEWAEELIALGFESVLKVENYQDFTDSLLRRDGVKTTWYCRKKYLRLS